VSELAMRIIFFYGLAADRQEYCFTKDFFLFFILDRGSPASYIYIHLVIFSHKAAGLRA